MKNGCLVHVSEVQQGLKCGCICPSCGEKMVARKGSKMAHHFAHQNAECSYGIETTLHLMAKEVLENKKKMLLPSVTIDFKHRASEVVSSELFVSFNEVACEMRMDNIIDLSQN